MKLPSRRQYRKKYETDERYTAGPDDFDNEYSLRNSKYGLWFETERLRLIFKVLNRQNILLDKKKALDIGCNYGFYSNLFAYLKRDATDVVGVDFIQGNIDTARRINSLVSYEQQDLYEGLEFADHSFDFILVNYVMCCITEHREEVMKEIESKVKSGGHVLFFDFYGDYQTNFIDFLVGLLTLRNPIKYAREKTARQLDKHAPTLSRNEVSQPGPGQLRNDRLCVDALESRKFLEVSDSDVSERHFQIVLH